MVTTKKAQPFIEEMLEPHQFRKDDFTWSFVENDFFIRKNGDKVDLCPSYCLVYLNGLKKDSFLLKAIQSNVSKVNAMKGSSGPQLMRIAVPDSIKLSDRIDVYVKGNVINIQDDLLNKNVYLRMDNKRPVISEAIVIKGSEFNIQDFLANNCFDTTVYRKSRKTLIANGAGLPAIESAFVTDSAIHLMTSLYYPIPKGGNDTVLSQKNFIYTRSLSDSKKTSLQCVVTDGLYEPLSGKYVLNPSMPFIIKDSRAYFSVSDYEDPLEKEFLAEFKLSALKPKFVAIVPNTTGPFRYAKKSEGFMLNKRLNKNFYFSTQHPYFYDYLRNEQFQLNPADFTLNFRRDYYIQDVIRSGENIQLLYSIGSHLIKNTYDKDKKLLSSEEVVLREELDITHAKFLTADSYLFLDKGDLVFYRP